MFDKLRAFIFILFERIVRVPKIASTLEEAHQGCVNLSLKFV
jgi:hypothetical protein